MGHGSPCPYKRKFLLAIALVRTVIAVPEGINAVGMHRITWPQMGPFIRREVGAMLDAANTITALAPLVLHEVALPYRTANQWGWAERLAA